MQLARRVLETEVAAIAVGIEEAHSASDARLDGRAARVAGRAQASERRAVKAAVLRENLRPTRDQPGHDERLVVRLAAAVDEETAIQVARRPLCQGLGKSRPLRRQHLRRDTAGLRRLLLDRGDDAL